MGQFNNVTFRINPASERAFADALKKLAYAKGKNMSDVVNKKLFYTARRAVWYTKAANASAIAKELGQNVTGAKGKRAGSVTMKGQSLFNNRRNKEGTEESLAERLVNFYRVKLGKKGLSGEKLQKAARALVGARLRSIGFLKAGWIAARDSMKRQARIMSAPEGTLAGGTKRAGVARLGDAEAAKPDRNKAFARIWNQASYGNKRNPRRGGELYGHDAALMKYGLPALEKAFREETADTMQELEKELRKSARAAGIKTN